MALPDERRARLSIDVAPELRRRIKIAAAARDLSVRDYVEMVLRHALESEELVEVSTGRRLTPDERERGLKAMAELERMDQVLLEQRGGRPFSLSWELLNESRDDRTRALLGDA
jgi:hypothetical protein